jgi:hypothetical protein
VKRQYKVLVGRYIGADPEDPTKDFMYVQGDIVETSIDLLRFNKPGAEKFELLIEGQPMVSETTWDPAAETLDQFVQRMRERGETAPTAKDASVPIRGPTGSHGPDDTLETMTAVELQKVATEEDVDLRGAFTREDIVGRIRKKLNA